ncbi:hypothetical protein J23TS9_41670 [Paenibacillus sp. J23TS9]|nr:hypothetical protein J23TS9_41670 [Paenibacillus sp. J23TS9]
MNSDGQASQRKKEGCGTLFLTGLFPILRRANMMDNDAKGGSSDAPAAVSRANAYGAWYNMLN